MRLWKVCYDRRRLWLPAVLLLALNGILYMGYRTLISERFDLAASRRERLEKEHKAATDQRDGLKRMLEGWRAAEGDIAAFYERVGRREEKLPELLTEIDALARKVGTVPHRINFGQSAVPEADLVEFRIEFPFEGDYANVRNLLNLLEVTPSFLIVDEFNMGSTGELGEKVRLQFRLRTVFHQERQP